MKKIKSIDVLIVGAGPTGLMAANQLNRFGIDFLVIDSKSGPTKESRALGVSARSMELYQQLGLAEQVQEQALPIIGFKIYSNGKLKGAGSLNDFGAGKSDFPHLLNIFEQSNNEKLLYTNLCKNGDDIFWNTSFEGLTAHQNHIEVKVKTANEIRHIRAGYVIGCDGASSPVRHELDFKFEGGTYENKFYVADTKLSASLDSDRIVLAPGDEVFTAFFPMKGDKRFRVIGTLPQTLSDKEDITFDDIKDSVMRSTKFDLDFEQVSWFSIYKLHHRCVDTFSKGNVFLAGDSAHIHSPAGGQGMNTGLQDAHNLCWKIAFVLKGYAHENLLNTYDDERMPFAKWLLSFTDKGFTVMSSPDWKTAMFRKYIALNVFSKLFAFKRTRQRIYNTLSQTWYSYADSGLSITDSAQKLTFKAGDRLPYIRAGIYKDFAAPCFHLLHISNNFDFDMESLIKAFPFPVKPIKNKISDGWDKFGVTAELFILIRPDTHIAYLSDQLDVEKIRKYLEKYFLVENGNK